MTDSAKDATNFKFLDRSIEVRDRIILSHKVTDINDVTDQFRKELDYLEAHGYELAPNGMEMIKK